MWLSMSIGIVITIKLFVNLFITEETGEEYFLKSQRMVWHYLGNCPPILPLTEQQSIDDKLGLMLG